MSVKGHEGEDREEIAELEDIESLKEALTEEKAQKQLEAYRGSIDQLKAETAQRIESETESRVRAENELEKITHQNWLRVLAKTWK